MLETEVLETESEDSESSVSLWSEIRGGKPNSSLPPHRDNESDSDSSPVCGVEHPGIGSRSWRQEAVRHLIPT